MIDTPMYMYMYIIVLQDLQVTKERASETAVTLEHYKQQNHELQKQCQDLQGEKEAMKAMVWITDSEVHTILVVGYT